MKPSLSSPPLVSGPGRGGLPVCISCYQLVDGDYYCTGCSWQCCGEHCELRDVHREECEIFREKNIFAAWDNVDEPTLTMDFMGAHRLLLAIKKEPKLRDLLKLNMNNDLRKQRYNIKYYVGCEDVITKYISETCGLTGFTDDEILTALGLFDILSLPMINGAKAFYPEVAFMTHSCVPNTYFTINSEGCVLMKASVDIEAGRPVTRSLVDLMKCNQFRRVELEKEYFLLDCDCGRCCDGTEFGTFYGGIMDSQYDKNIFTPRDPKNEHSPWICDSLPGVELDGETCRKDLDILRRKCENAIEETQGNPGTIEFILNNPGEWDLLPRTGQVMMDVKKYLIQAYGNSFGNTYDVLDNDKIRTKILICEEMIELYSKFHPGYNYHVAMIHYEAANAIYALAMKGDKDLLESGMKHCEKCLKMVQNEESGSMYDQLKLFMLTLSNGLKNM